MQVMQSWKEKLIALCHRYRQQYKEAIAAATTESVEATHQQHQSGHNDLPTLAGTANVLL